MIGIKTAQQVEVFNTLKILLNKTHPLCLPQPRLLVLVLSVYPKIPYNYKLVVQQTNALEIQITGQNILEWRLNIHGGKVLLWTRNGFTNATITVKSQILFLAAFKSVSTNLIKTLQTTIPKMNKTKRIKAVANFQIILPTKLRVLPTMIRVLPTKKRVHPTKIRVLPTVLLNRKTRI